jgi:hypothetical protein
VPINPLLFGFKVKDFHRPRINRIKIYAADSNSLVNGSNNHAIYRVEGWGEEHRLVASSPVKLSGKIGFGVQCHDQQNDTRNKNGIYSMKLYLDNRLVSSTRMESFSFNQTRFINSLIDYREFKSSKIRFQRTEIDPGNHLDIYENPEGRGLVFIDDTLRHEVKVEVADIAGNVSLLQFQVHGDIAAPAMEMSLTTDVVYDPALFHYNGQNRFETEDFVIEAATGAFYRNFKFNYTRGPVPDECLAALHQVQDEYTPVHKPVSIRIKPSDLPGGLEDKALIVKFNGEESTFYSLGGNYTEEGFVETTVREFGNFSVAMDTIPPQIIPVNSSAHKQINAGSLIKFIIKDDLSGIRSYRGTINGQWILMEYDAKNESLFYYADDHVKEGTNEFRLEVSDMKDNRQVYETTLTR